MLPMGVGTTEAFLFAVLPCKWTGFHRTYQVKSCVLKVNMTTTVAAHYQRCQMDVVQCWKCSEWLHGGWYCGETPTELVLR